MWCSCTYARIVALCATPDQHPCEARDEPPTSSTSTTAAGSYGRPDWYLGVWTLKTGFDASDGVTRIPVHVSECSEDGAFLW